MVKMDRREKMRVRWRKHWGRLQEKEKKMRRMETHGVEQANLVVLAGSLYLVADFFISFWISWLVICLAWPKPWASPSQARPGHWRRPSNGFGLAQSSQKPKAAGPGRSFVVVLQCVLLIKKKIFTWLRIHYQLISALRQHFAICSVWRRWLGPQFSSANIYESADQFLKRSVIFKCNY